MNYKMMSPYQYGKYSTDWKICAIKVSHLILGFLPINIDSETKQKSEKD